VLGRGTRLVPASMVCTDALHRLHGRACLPDGARGVPRQHFGAQIAKFGVLRARPQKVGTLAPRVQSSSDAEGDSTESHDY
jgi:hypothetical protein